jgi:hypothetical protein
MQARIVLLYYCGVLTLVHPFPGKDRVSQLRDSSPLFATDAPLLPSSANHFCSCLSPLLRLRTH